MKDYQKISPTIDSPKSISRCAFLLGTAAAGITALLAGCGFSARNRNTSNRRSDGNDGDGLFDFSINTVRQVDFANPLVIPPLAQSTVNDGRRTFDLTAQAGSSQILPEKQTQTWGFNGAMLGPTLRAHRGEEVAIRFRNELDETTTVHWHGMHLPASMDGGPHQLVASGQSWQPHWQINQPAATLWYHPHPHGETEKHVYQGLAGLFIIDDDTSNGLALPADYGIDDIPVIVQDKVFNEAGQLRLAERAEVGLLGDTILVNGTYGPYLDVTTSKVRLRILNGSTARIYNFGFNDDRNFQLIGTDGGLLTAPYHTNRIQLSPGERAEIVVELEPNRETILRTYPPELGAILSIANAYGSKDSFDILQLRAAPQLQPVPDVPSVLAAIEPLREGDAAQTREFRLDGRKINGRGMDMSRIDEVITAGNTEIWDLFNQNLYPHNFHIHDVQFQILDIGGNPPSPELAGWKDTVYLRPQTHYRVIMRFEEYVDPHVPYMYHCHLLWHEDTGMMGQFVVVEAGEESQIADRLPDSHEHGH
jgi:FtsP/CotA-like multicopper oxidase with cupredoxin domain